MARPGEEARGRRGSRGGQAEGDRMDTEGCKFVKYRLGGEGATARKEPLTNSIYITFGLREETSKA